MFGLMLKTPHPILEYLDPCTGSALGATRCWDPSHPGWSSQLPLSSWPRAGYCGHEAAEGSFLLLQSVNGKEEGWVGEKWEGHAVPRSPRGTQLQLDTSSSLRPPVPTHTETSCSYERALNTRNCSHPIAQTHVHYTIL